jgi:hypothetical protein
MVFCVVLNDAYQKIEMTFFCINNMDTDTYFALRCALPKVAVDIIMRELQRFKRIEHKEQVTRYMDPLDSWARAIIASEEDLNELLPKHADYLNDELIRNGRRDLMIRK